MSSSRVAWYSPFARSGTHFLRIIRSVETERKQKEENSKGEGGGRKGLRGAELAPGARSRGSLRASAAGKELLCRNADTLPWGQSKILLGEKENARR